MDRHGLPGIEELFREQDRLAKKLSQEEISALRRYLQRAVHAECESVVARMRYLQAAHDVNESQFQHALVTLQKDLQREQTIASEFRREFGSLARVFQARELRYQGRHETLVQEMLKCREAVKEAIKAREVLEADLQQKEKELLQHKDMVVDLEDQLAYHKDCDKLRDDVCTLGKDLLKAKLDKDKLRKELADVKAKLERGGAKGTATRPSLAANEQNKQRVRFSPSAPPPKSGPVTFTSVIPYCTSNTCRARQDLEECRVQFVKKCEEVAYLRCVLSEKKEKSREQLIFPTNRAAGKPAATVQPLKPAYQRGKESFFGTSSRLVPPTKSFKLGPLAPADKKQ